MLLVWLGWQQLNPAEPIFAAYFEPYPDLYTTRGAAGPAAAFQPYNRQEYSQAVAPLQRLFEASGDSLVLFYRAVAQVGAHAPADAISVLAALQHSSTAPTEAVRWYLALAYAQTGNTAAALSLLQELASRENQYRQSAKALGKALGEDL